MFQFPAPVHQTHLRRNGVQHCPGHAGRGNTQPVDRLQRIKLRDSRKVIRTDEAAGIQSAPVGGAVHHAQLQQIPVVLAQCHRRHVRKLTLIFNGQQQLPVAVKVVLKDLLH